MSTGRPTGKSTKMNNSITTAKNQEKALQELNELIQETKSKLGLMESEKLCIYRVPNKLRMVKAEAYTPRIVSIGPLHRDNAELVAMEDHKWRYMLQFIQHAPEDQSHKCFEHCTKALYELDEDVRGCYAEKIELDRGALTKVMLLDGCFILELFLRVDQLHSSNKKLEGRIDTIFSNAWMIPALRQDLALLENQIPFFILEVLYGVIKPHLDNNHSVTSLALNFFQPMNHKASSDRRNTGQDYNHLLDLLHEFYVLPSLESPTVANNYNHQPVKNGADDGQLSINLTIQLAPPASHLNKGFDHGASKILEKGVEFEKESTQVHLLNITFKKGVLKIPPIFVNETTDSLFRNLIAFEQCHLKASHHFTSYALLIKSLIRSEEDSKLLQKKDIINQNWIGDHRLIDFNTILIHVHPNDFCFHELCQEVNAYRKLRFRRKVKSLYGTYFSTAWSMIAFIAAVSAFVLTVIQTYFSVYPRH